MTIDETEIDQILPSSSSIMPSGLLDNLSLQDISDLMAYLGVIPSLEVASSDSAPKVMVPRPKTETDRDDCPRGRCSMPPG